MAGSETFRTTRGAFAPSILDFWAWDGSDLLSNATRGRLAEFLIATSLGISTGGVRSEWDAYDLLAPNGLRLEVKSSAYLQAWHQKAFSTIQFAIGRTRAWHPQTNDLAPEPQRQSDAYIFALLHHTDKTTVEPLDLEQWTFWAVPTVLLDERLGAQRSLPLRTLKALGGEGVHLLDLPTLVDAVTGHRRPP